jgi:DHA1 family inner membrane transport protein
MEIMKSRLPFVVFLLALGTFLMCTSEYLVAGLLPQMSADFGVSLATTGLLITAFAIGMIVGAPAMAIATLRLPRRATLVLALAVFAGVGVPAGSWAGQQIGWHGVFWALAVFAGSQLAGRALDSSLGAVGPAVVGLCMVTLGLVPLLALVRLGVRNADHSRGHELSPSAARKTRIISATLAQEA